MSLTAAQLSAYHRDGYLVIPGFFAVEVAAQLKRRADELQSQLDLSTHPRTIFRSSATGSQTIAVSTLGRPEEQKQQAEQEQQQGREEAKEERMSASASAADDYFLDSADKIGFFFEDGAFDSAGGLAVSPARAINKIGHALHALDPVFSAFSLSAAVLAVASSLSFRSPVLLQSMLIFKHPRIGSVVTPHRDSTFLFTQPSTAVGFWFALEDCTTSNGCLAFVKGSHRDAGSDRRLRRTGRTQRTINNVPAASRQSEAAAAAAAPINRAVKLEFTGQDRTIAEYREQDWTVEPVSAGSLVLIHGDVVHRSSHNHSDRSRYIYTFHLIDDYDTEYPVDNWLQSERLFTHLKNQPQLPALSDSCTDK